MFFIVFKGLAMKQITIFLGRRKSDFNSFMREVPVKSMDWFLYDRAIRHERVKYE